MKADELRFWIVIALGCFCILILSARAIEIGGWGYFALGFMIGAIKHYAELRWGDKKEKEYGP